MQPIESSSESPNAWDGDTLEQSLEVVNFLEAIERIITRLFGVAENAADNEDGPTDMSSEEE